MRLNDPLAKCTGFEWDEGNFNKNWEKHGVSNLECEQIFFNQPLITQQDEKHSTNEPRYYALGQTDAFRKLFTEFFVCRSKDYVIYVNLGKQNVIVYILNEQSCIYNSNCKAILYQKLLKPIIPSSRSLHKYI